MPKETFWNSATAVEDDGVSEPVLTVTWGAEHPGIYLNGVEFDLSGIERLMNVLRRAIGKERTVTVTLIAEKTDFDKAMDESLERIRVLRREIEELDSHARHAGHKILEAPVIGSRWVPRRCTTCNVELEPREDIEA